MVAETPKPWELSRTIMCSVRSWQETDIDAIEASVVDDPDDLMARARLVGCYEFRNETERLLPHLLYLIDRCPSALDGVFADPERQPHLYSRIAAAWKNAAESTSDSRVVLSAIRVIGHASLDDAQVLFDRWLDRATDKWEWYERAAELHFYHAVKQDSEALFGKAAHFYDLALASAPVELGTCPRWSPRNLMLDSAARASLRANQFEKAEALAREAVSAQGPGSERLRHRGHTILGLIALRGGQVELAQQHLLDSARDVGGYYIGSYGPSLLLADSLLAVGRRDAVLEYLAAVREEWPKGQGQIDTWSEEIRRGGNPDWRSHRDHL